MKLIKYITLIVLFVAGFFAIAGESEEITLRTLILIKIAGFFSVYAGGCLMTAWYKDGSLPGLDRIFEEDE